MRDETLPPDAPDPDTITEAEENPDPLEHPLHTHTASDPTDPVGQREDATGRAD